MSKPTIMIVEDEFIIADDLKERLKDIGYHVSAWVTSGEAAIEQSGQDRPDLILMDIMLEGEIDGIEAAEHIRKQFNIPIVFMTAFSDREIIERAKTTGSFGYILKPFENKLLDITIDMALCKAEMEKKFLRTQDELEKRVKERTINLEETNTALRVLLKRRYEDKAAIEEKVLLNVKELVLPYLEKLKKSRLDERQKSYLNIMESNLNDIVGPFVRKLSSRYLNLTPTEIRTANFIRQGKTTREIAEVLNLSPRTIDTHRDNIRKKLGIKDRKINLRTYLLSIE